MYRKQIIATVVVLAAAIFLITQTIRCANEARMQHVEFIDQLLRNPNKIKRISQSGNMVVIEEKTLNNIPGEGLTHSIELGRIKNPELLREYAVVENKQK